MRLPTSLIIGSSPPPVTGALGVIGLSGRALKVGFSNKGELGIVKEDIRNSKKESGYLGN